MESNPRTGADKLGVSSRPLLIGAAVCTILVVDVLSTRAVLAAEAASRVSSAGSTFLVLAILLASMTLTTFLLQRQAQRAQRARCRDVDCACNSDGNEGARASTAPSRSSETSTCASQ